VKEAYLLQSRMMAVRFVLVGRDAGQTKEALRPKPEGLFAPGQKDASPDSAFASELGGAVGTSASARLSLRTELARTLLKIVTFAAFPFLDLPLSRSYLVPTSIPSTRT
jgi:hypothetical protein